MLQAASAIVKTVTGALPLVLSNAINHAIVSLTRYGLCTQDGTPTTSAPVDIMCNNGVLKWDSVNQRVYADGAPEVLTVLANQNTDPTIVKATLASGETDVRYNTTSSCIVAPVKPNTTYTIGFLTKPTGGAIFRVATTKTKVTSSQTSVASIAYDLNKNDYEPKTLNSGEDAAWMYVQLSNIMTGEDFASILIQEGTSLTPPQTASVADLYAVNDYKDTQEIIGGTVTHKVGIKVFDGTESFGKSSAYGAAFYIQSAANVWGAKREIVMCSHYLGLAAASSAAAEDTCFFNASGHFYFRVADNSDTAAFKAWLASEYANGTPVIVLYPLATETTEQTTAQHLVTNKGTNIIDSTSNASPIDAEVEYAAKKGA